MKFVVSTMYLVVAALMTQQLSTAGVTTNKYRVAWESTVTGAKGHGSWMGKEAAFAGARHGNYDTPALKHHVQQKRQILFVPLPSKNITLTSGFASTAGMKKGDTVRYHLSEWELGRSKVGKVQGTYGDSIVFIDGMAMGVTCVLEHRSK